MKAARDFIKELEVGDKVEIVITQPENDKGQTLLSLKKAAADYLWNYFEEKLKTGEAVKVVGKEVNRGGLVVEARGLQGFIPASQFGSQWEDKIDKLVGRQVEVKPIEVDRKKNRLIFSEREISEAALLKAQEKALKKVKKGDVFAGEITGVMPFGFFVQIEVNKVEVEGLVHISEISWQRVEEPQEFYQVGDKVKVKVLAIDKATGKLNLSIKQLKPDPWQEIDKKYPVDTKVKGKVVRLAPFGAFVDLEEGIEGLIHISKIPAEKALKEGDKVDCYVESIDKEGRRMSLGLVLKEKPVGYK
jgi:small subunit ribosomal protein S1